MVYVMLIVVAAVATLSVGGDSVRALTVAGVGALGAGALLALVGWAGALPVLVRLGAVAGSYGVLVLLVALVSSIDRRRPVHL